MSRARAIWLVARRELLERGRSKGFLGSLILTEVFVVGSMLLQAQLASGENRLDVGYVGQPPVALEQAMDAIARQSDGTVDLHPYPDRASAEAALAADEVEGVVVPGD